MASITSETPKAISLPQTDTILDELIAEERKKAEKQKKDTRVRLKVKITNEALLDLFGKEINHPED